MLSTEVNNVPLNSAGQFKLIGFIILLGAATLLWFGVIPILSIAVGYFLMKKNRDFSNIEVSVKIVLFYFTALMVLSALAALVFLVLSVLAYRLDDYSFDDYMVGFFSTFVGVFIFYFYSLATKRWYLRTLSNHKGWVTVNGAFSNVVKIKNDTNNKPGVEILQSKKLKPYSVADELLKWAKLKDDGHISEQEFDEARAKLLNRE